MDYSTEVKARRWGVRHLVVKHDTSKGHKWKRKDVFVMCYVVAKEHLTVRSLIQNNGWHPSDQRSFSRTSQFL